MDWARQETKHAIEKGRRTLYEQREAMEELRRLALPSLLAGMKTESLWQVYPVRTARFQVTYPEYLDALQEQDRAATIMKLAVAGLVLLKRKGNHEQRLEASLMDAKILIELHGRLPQGVLELCRELQAQEERKNEK